MPPATLAAVLADDAFPALARAADASYLEPVLRRALGVNDASLGDVTVLNHKPGRRCTLLYEVDLVGARQRLVGKWQRDAGLARRHFERLKALNEALDAPALPRALLVTDDGLVLQTYVTGRELRDLAPDNDSRPFAAAGEWLARLHALTPPAGLSAKTPAHELAKVEAWCAQVAMEPELAPDASQLSARLRALSRQLTSTRTTIIHRDYYPANLIWDSDALWGIDIDQMALGDPAVDAGSFAAQLEKLALRTTGRIDAYDAHRRAFLNAYGPIDAGALSFFTGYTFVKLAAAEVQRQHPDWRQVAASFLRRGIGPTPSDM